MRTLKVIRIKKRNCIRSGCQRVDCQNRCIDREEIVYSLNIVLVQFKRHDSEIPKYTELDNGCDQ